MLLSKSSIPEAALRLERYSLAVVKTGEHNEADGMMSITIAVQKMTEQAVIDKASWRNSKSGLTNVAASTLRDICGRSRPIARTLRFDVLSTRRKLSDARLIRVLPHRRARARARLRPRPIASAHPALLVEPGLRIVDHPGFLFEGQPFVHSSLRRTSNCRHDPGPPASCCDACAEPTSPALQPPPSALARYATSAARWPRI